MWRWLKGRYIFCLFQAQTLYGKPFLPFLGQRGRFACAALVTTNELRKGLLHYLSNVVTLATFDIATFPVKIWLTTKVIQKNSLLCHFFSSLSVIFIEKCYPTLNQVKIVEYFSRQPARLQRLFKAV